MQCFRSMSGLFAALAVGVAAAAGCQPRVSLTEYERAKPSAVQQRYSSSMAVFANSAQDKQTIVLALQPTGAAPASTAPTGRDTLEPKGPMKYRAYLLLVVAATGGKCQIGQNILSGQVRATYYIYGADGQLKVIPDRLGWIETRLLPGFGGFDSDEWWIDGSFDLLMGTDVRLAGRFVARPAPTLVDRFMREHKL